MRVPKLPNPGDDVLDWSRDVARYLRKTRPALVKPQKRQIEPEPLPFTPIITGVELADSSSGDFTGLKVTINPLSTLLKGEALDDVATITGLAEQWTIDATKIVVLKAMFSSDAELDTAEILSGEPSDLGWDVWKPYELGSTYDGDEDKSQTWWQLLAYLRPVREHEAALIRLDDTGYVLGKPTKSDLQVQWKCAEDDARRRIRVLAPWHGAHEAE